MGGERPTCSPALSNHPYFPLPLFLFDFLDVRIRLITCPNALMSSTMRRIEAVGQICNVWITPRSRGPPKKAANRNAERYGFSS